MQEDDFKLIKQWLEHGQILAMAKAEGCTPRTAYNRLSGKTKNIAFVEKALKIALENRQRFKSGMEKLKSLDAA
jgi:hypothetical protein